ncbi:MAG: nucleotidyltransferase [Bacteroidales bacterium]
MKPTLLVLAAGLGSRYGSLKQVDSFGPGGEAIIEYSVFDALRSGFGRVVFVIAPSMEKDFSQVFASKFPDEARVSYVIQDLKIIPERFQVPEGRIKPWGTGHAVMMAAKNIREPFAVINGDDFYGRISYEKVCQFLCSVKPDEPRFCLAGYPLGNTLSKHGTVSRGVCQVDAEGFLTRIVENTKIGYAPDGSIVNTGEDGTITPLSADSMVSMNLFGFTPAYFDFLEKYFAKFLENNIQNLKAEFYLPFVVDELIHNGQAQVMVIPTPESWFGVTYKEDKPYVAEMLKQLTDKGLYPTPLWRHN